MENGWSIERPDWWVAQVPVHALRFDPDMRGRLEEWLSASKVGRVAENAKALKGDITRLVEGKDPKESKQFINVVGGSLDGPALDRAAAELDKQAIIARLRSGTNAARQWTAPRRARRRCKYGAGKNGGVGLFYNLPTTYRPL